MPTSPSATATTASACGAASRQRSKRWTDPQPESVDAAFKAVGTAILSNTGGAAGAVFGTLFRSGAEGICRRRQGRRPQRFAGFLEEGLAAVLKRGGVIEGQKTMVDALAPAARAARDGSRRRPGRRLRPRPPTARCRASRPRKTMIATTGKARSLGERSIGHPDPGAISISLILKAMQDFCAKA